MTAKQREKYIHDVAKKWLGQKRANERTKSLAALLSMHEHMGFCIATNLIRKGSMSMLNAFTPERLEEVVERLSTLPSGTSQEKETT